MDLANCRDEPISIRIVAVRTINGTVAPKCKVTVKVSDGYLVYFDNTLTLWSVGDTTVNITRERARELALSEVVRYYRDNYNISIRNNIAEITEELAMTNIVERKNRLYPVWRSPLSSTRP